MYIVDKNRDYYDYLSHIYGLDKRIVFDRRGSIKLSDEDIVNVTNYLRYRWYGNNNDYFIILEIGNVQYLIEISKIKSKEIELIEKFISCSMEIIYVFRNNIHYYESYISIRGANIKSRWKWKKSTKKREYILNDNYKDIITAYNNDRSIDLPILAETQITSLINEEEIWKELQNYISSLNNDKDVSIPMTDVEKAVNHGFDKKTSFRHPIK